MWDPGFCQPSTCHSRTFSGSHSENGVPRSPMKASQGSYFPIVRPSSGVIVTGPQFSTCLTTCSCQEGEPPLKSHFPTHGDEGTWRCPGRAPSGGRAWCGQLKIAWGYLRYPPGKGPEASMLSTVPPETSVKPLPLGFPGAEYLVSQETAGQHPSE